MDAASSSEAAPSGAVSARRARHLGLPVSTAFAAVVVAAVALARAGAAFDLESGGDGLWLLIDIAAAVVVAGWGALRVLDDRRDGAGYLLQLAGLAWAVAAACDTGALIDGAWAPFGPMTDDVQVAAHLLARSLLVAAVILVLPDRDEDGFLRRGPAAAATAGLTVVAVVVFAWQPADSILTETPFGFGNRTWIEAAAAMPRLAIAAVLFVQVAALVALHRARHGLPPTSFQVIGWSLVAAGSPLAIPGFDGRLPSGVLDTLAVAVFPALPVLAVLAALRSVAAATRTVNRLRVHQQHLVDAVETERRRLRTDLHDTLGPTLAGIALGLRAAAERIADVQPATGALLERLAGEAESGLEDVRRIAYEIRPPALDQLGLAGAISAAAERTCGALPGLHLSVRMDELPPLPAAMEIALYRIATEAMTNVARHAGASGVGLSLQLEQGHIVLEVVDDGAGLPADLQPGIGLTSMRERAEDVGGRVTVGSGPLGGTEVRCRLPIATT